jgi:hypothetical protein
MSVETPVPFSWEADAVRELFKPPSEDRNDPLLPAILPFPVTVGKFYVVRPSDPEDDNEEVAPFWLVLVHSTGLMVDGVEHVRVHYLTIEERQKVTKKQPKDKVQERINFLTGENANKMNYLHDIPEARHVFFAAGYYWREKDTEDIPVSIIQCAVDMKTITTRTGQDQNQKRCLYKVTEGIMSRHIHKVANAARRFAGKPLFMEPSLENVRASHMYFLISTHTNLTPRRSAGRGRRRNPPEPTAAKHS